jgi:hypothetical protein
VDSAANTECSKPFSIRDPDHYRWTLLNPGEGTVIQCRCCGRFAHSKDLPAGHGGYNWERRRYLLDDEGLHWTEVHQCDPADVVKVTAANEAKRLGGQWSITHGRWEMPTPEGVAAVRRHLGTRGAYLAGNEPDYVTAAQS